MKTANQPADLNSAAAKAEAGMRVEGIDVLQPGSYLFKLVQRADVRDTKYICSPWWFQEASLRKILLHARDNREHCGIPLNTATTKQARDDAALSVNWVGSGSHYTFVGKVIAPVTFLWGAPKPVGFRTIQSKNQKRTSGLNSGTDVEEIEVVPNPLCVQFYLPGMEDQNIAAKCIAPQGKFKFAHSRELADGDIEGFLRSLKGMWSH